MHLERTQSAGVTGLEAAGRCSSATAQSSGSALQAVRGALPCPTELIGDNEEKRNLGCCWVVLKGTANEIAWGQRECELRGSSSFLGSCLIKNIVSCQESMKQS